MGAHEAAVLSSVYLRADTEPLLQELRKFLVCEISWNFDWSCVNPRAVLHLQRCARQIAGLGQHCDILHFGGGGVPP